MPQVLLCIDGNKSPPTFSASAGPGSLGNLQLLHDNEVGDYAKWVGIVGGRALLDAFEVALINDGLLRVWPIDDDGAPVYDECDAVAIEHHDDGMRIIWCPKVLCKWCGGAGHHNLGNEPVTEEDLCGPCDGQGWGWGNDVATDLDGRSLPAGSD